ncbi:MAG: DUF4249 domain-containing protein [Flavobacteriaceae bacterium]
MKILKVLSIFVILATIISCSDDFFNKPIDLDINNHTSKLAATAILGIDDNSDRVLVSYSIGPFESNSTNQIIEEARLTITGNNDVFNFAPMAQDDFFFANTSLDFQPNKAYTLSITAPNYETITATQTYPTAVPILEASINENTFKIKFNDNPTTEDFYLLKLYKEDLNNPGVFQSKWIEPFGNSSKYSGFCWDCVIFNDGTFNGDNNVEIVVNHGYLNPDTIYKAVLYHVTEDYYKYDVSLLNSQNAEDNPFVEPVILHRNFDNGYGVFTLVNKTELLFNN